MNRKIEINFTCKYLFIVNMIILFSLVLFKSVYTKLGYYYNLVNSIFIFNIILFIIMILYNIYTLFNPKLKQKNIIIIISLIFILYILFNTLGIYLLNIPYNKKYLKISNKLTTYCEKYMCDTFDTINNKSNKSFIIRKTYLDYNNNLNDIEIKNDFNSKKVYYITAYIYSNNRSFSAELIKDELDLYLKNFNITLDEELIKKAFDKRFKGEIESKNIKYKVVEIYDKKKVLQKLKTKISIKL